MPKSSTRNKVTARKRAHDRLVRDALRQEKPGGWKRRVGWATTTVGAVLFAGGNIGARTGLVFLPFDPHHVLAQVGGAIILMIGLAGILRGSSGGRS